MLIARADGATAAAWVPPHAAALHELARRGQWEKAVRLCRCVWQKRVLLGTSCAVLLGVSTHKPLRWQAACS